MKIKYSILFAVVFILMSSCTNKEDGVILDERLVPFFEIFKEEAAKRDVVFDNSVEQIEGYIQSVAGQSVIGICKRNENVEKHRQLIFDSPYWKTATKLEKEYVVFHELGHCFLGLGHDDSANGQGVCNSIMASGLGSCRDNFNTNTREELLDELFSN